MESQALEFSERLFIKAVTSEMPRWRQSLILTEWSMQSEGDSYVQLTIILNILCELGSDEKVLVDDIGPYYHAAEFRPGEPIFLKNGQP